MKAYLKEHWLLLRERVELAVRSVKERWWTMPPSRRFRRIAVWLLCAALLAPLVLTAFDVRPACDLVYRVSPALAQFLRPVRTVSVCEGIEMRVKSIERTGYEGNDVSAVLEMRDLAGDRLDEDSDLHFHLSVRYGFRGLVDCAMDPGEFDESSRTLRLPIRFNSCEGGRVSGKLTFSLYRIRASARRLEEPLPVELASVGPVTPVPTSAEELNGFDPMHPERAAWRLEPGLLCSPMDGVELSGLGYIDGYLHVQLRFTDELHAPVNGDVFLESDALGEIYSTSSFGFDGPDGFDYEELLFEIAPEDADGCRLRANLLRYEDIIDGVWCVTFDIPE